MSKPTFPLEFSAYWGADPNRDDQASTLRFDTPAELEAYRTGLNQADGWFGASFLPHPNFKVSKDGDFTEGKKIPAVKEGQRFVMWGEKPEKGETPETVEFDTALEAEAFQQGVEDMVGWTKCFFVPSPDFKPFDSIEDAQSYFDPATARVLAAYLDNNDLDGVDGPYFVKADGSFVHQDWNPGDVIENVLLKPADWNARFEEQLKTRYGLTVKDSGLASEDLERWREGFERDPNLAVETYAEKFDLTPVRSSSPSP